MSHSRGRQNRRNRQRLAARNRVNRAAAVEQPQDDVPQPDPASKEVGNVGILKAYAIIEALRSGVDVTALGFGVSGVITPRSSILTAAANEALCTALSLVVASHEIFTVCREQCCRPDGLTVESTVRPATEYSIYLFMRIGSIVASSAGLIMLALDAAENAVPTLKTTLGVTFISAGLVLGRYISGGKHKSTEVLFQEDFDELDEAEQGFGPGPDDRPPVEPQGVPLLPMARAAQPPAGSAGRQHEMEAVRDQLMERARLEEVPLVSDNSPVVTATVVASLPGSPAPRRNINHFYQPEGQPAAPQSAAASRAPQSAAAASQAPRSPTVSQQAAQSAAAVPAPNSAAPQPPSATQGPAVKAAAAAHNRTKRVKGQKLFAPAPASTAAASATVPAASAPAPAASTATAPAPELTTVSATAPRNI